MGAAFEDGGPRAWRWWLVAANAACVVASTAGCVHLVRAASHSVAGKVTLGPQCGGPQREGQSCDIDYAAVQVQLLDDRGRTAASAQTDAQGRFVLAGPAGRYTVRVISTKVVRCPDQSVLLPQTGSAAVAIACDSGMR